jgi:hypothetical protein
MIHCRFVIPSILTVLLIVVDINLVSAQQPIYRERLSGRLIKEARFDELLPSILVLVDSAINHYDNEEEERPKSVQDLKMILAMEEVKKTSSLFRAWVYQWLALNYFALDSSMALVEQHVKRSLDENVEIWREYPDLKRLSEEVKDIYQICWEEIENKFRKKLRSVRIAAGPISRVDFSYRVFEHWDIVGGIGTPIKWSFQEDLEKSKILAFDQLVLYARVQRMRKYIERLTAGIYLGFTLEQDTSKTGIQFTKYLSAGPILSYAFQSSWEIGSTFEIARLAIGRGASTDLSNTALKGKTFTLSYSVFEIYIRKWF